MAGSKKNNYWSKGTKAELRELMERNPSTQHYFDKDVVKGFGSQVQSIYRSPKGNHYVFSEKYTGSPDGKPKFKVAYFSPKTNEFKSYGLYENADERNAVRNEIMKNTKSSK